MRACSGCTADYDEQFKFCPHCGTAFGDNARPAQMSATFTNVVRAADRERSFELASGESKYEREVPYEMSPETREAARQVAVDMGLL